MKRFEFPTTAEYQNHVKGLEVGYIFTQKQANPTETLENAHAVNPITGLMDTALLNLIIPLYLEDEAYEKVTLHHGENRLFSLGKKDPLILLEVQHLNDRVTVIHLTLNEIYHDVIAHQAKQR